MNYVTLKQAHKLLDDALRDGVGEPGYVLVPVDAVRRLVQFLDRRREHPVTLVRDNDDLHALLLELWGYMDDHEDVSDGDDGRPVANAAMRFKDDIDAAIQFVLTRR